MKRVKGSMAKPIIKILRADKSGVYEHLLSTRAHDLSMQHILDPVWYSFSAFKECFNAMCQVEGKNSPTTLIQWGKKWGKKIMTTVYHSTFMDASLQTTIYGYTRFHRLAFNFGNIVGKIVSDHEIVLSYNDFEPGWRNFAYIAAGWACCFFELCLGKSIACKILNNSTDISLSWN